MGRLVMIVRQLGDILLPSLSSFKDIVLHCGRQPVKAPHATVYLNNSGVSRAAKKCKSCLMHCVMNL
jgi:hypothetical protein